MRVPEYIKVTDLVKMQLQEIETKDGRKVYALVLPANPRQKTSPKPWFNRSVLLGGTNMIGIQSYNDDPSTLWIHARRGNNKVSLGLSRKKVLYLKKVLNEWLRLHPAEVSKHNEPKVRDESGDSGHKGDESDLTNKGVGDKYKYNQPTANLPPSEPPRR